MVKEVEFMQELDKITHEEFISNFTFDSKTNTISFFSTKTNKCWSMTFDEIDFSALHETFKIVQTKKLLNALKKLIKNGNN